MPQLSFKDILSSMAAKCASPEDLCGTLQAGGIAEPAVFSFGSVPGTFVVRALIPELETWHPTGGESTFGPFAQKLFL